MGKQFAGVLHHELGWHHFSKRVFFLWLAIGSVIPSIIYFPFVLVFVLILLHLLPCVSACCLNFSFWCLLVHCCSSFFPSPSVRSSFCPFHQVSFVYLPPLVNPLLLFVLFPLAHFMCQVVPLVSFCCWSRYSDYSCYVAFSLSSFSSCLSSPESSRAASSSSWFAYLCFHCSMCLCILSPISSSFPPSSTAASPSFDFHLPKTFHVFVLLICLIHLLCLLLLFDSDLVFNHHHALVIIVLLGYVCFCKVCCLLCIVLFRFFSAVNWGKTRTYRRSLSRHGNKSQWFPVLPRLSALLSCQAWNGMGTQTQLDGQSCHNWQRSQCWNGAWGFWGRGTKGEAKWNWQLALETKSAGRAHVPSW